MTYRTLTIDGIGYQYVIGRKYVKIRGGKAVPKSDIGFFVADGFDEHYIITPGMIKDFLIDGKIKGPENYFPTCRHLNQSPMRLGYEPFSAEIDGKHHLVYWCAACYENSADNI